VIIRAARRLLAAFSHLGVACESRQAVDELCATARDEGVLCQAPRDLGPPVGYFGLIQDPDGNTLEVSYGQEVGLAVGKSTS
jgi:predicted lactoylglutathione lyase